MLFWNAMSILEMGRGLAASTLRCGVEQEPVFNTLQPFLVKVTLSM